MQDFVLACELEICYGDQTVTGEALLGTYLGLQGECENEVCRQIIVLRQPAARILNIRLEWYHRIKNDGSEGLKFSFLTDLSLELVCTDPRDHIYGLLGLLNVEDLKILDLEPDYSKDTEWLLFTELIGKADQNGGVSTYTEMLL